MKRDPNLLVDVMTLCDACKSKRDEWLDYRAPRTVKIASGASRDDTTAGVADAQRGRYEAWRNTIRQQQDLIHRICQEKHRAVVEAPSTPAMNRDQNPDAPSHCVSPSRDQ